MSIIVSLALASICFTFNGVEECHPALVGKKHPTPTGTYQVIERITDDPGYGGDVLQFKEEKDMVFALHRLYLLNESEHRLTRIQSKDISQRFITNGCINVMPEVYNRIKDCCSNDTITIN
jgi:hypothetical protein